MQQGETPSRKPRRQAWRWVAVAAAALLVLTVSGVLIARAVATRALFLRTPADDISGNPALVGFALSQGAAAYGEHCASCHGARLQGDPVRAVPNLADNDWLYGSGRVSEIERVILYGIRSGNSKGWDLAHMPAFATPHPYNLYAMAPLTPDDIHDVTSYLLAFRHPEADTAAAARGGRIFHDTNKGVCNDCHGFDAKGDSAIGAPDLTDGVWLWGDGSRAAIEESIAHGLSGSCPAWVGTLSPVTIRALAVYVHAQREASK